MVKKTRKSILIGQIALFIFGSYLLWGASEIVRYSYSTLWYSGPSPAIFAIPGVFCFILLMILFSVLRYEAPDEFKIKAPLNMPGLEPPSSHTIIKDK